MIKRKQYMKNIKSLLNPNSIAVIGASRHPQKIGHLIFKNIIEGGFTGKIFPVNPNAKEIINHPAYKSVQNIVTKIDLAIIVVPHQIVPQVLKECGQKEIANAVIISAGFAEIGQEGVEREKEINQIAEKYAINFLGPNCLGFVTPLKNLNASWGGETPQRGNIAFLSQSGALFSPIVELANQKGLGFSYFVSLGNKANLSENDFLDFFKTDPQTEIIIAYLESFHQGQKLIELSQEISPKKPIIFLKSGLEKTGANAAQSHTASLATPKEITKGILRQAGIIQAQNLRELFNLATIFVQNKNKKAGKNLAIITNGGGPSVLAADAIGQSRHLQLAKFSSQARDKLSQLLPAESSLKNPIDLLGDASAATYKKATQIILDDNNVDAILEILTKQRGTEIEKTARAISQINHPNNKIIIASFMGGKKFQKIRKIFQKNHIANFIFPKEAIQSLDRLTAYQKNCQKIKSPMASIKINCVGIKEILTGVKQENRKQLNEAEGFRLLNYCQIKTPSFIIINKRKDLKKAIQKIGFPSFLKILSSEISHKTEQGGVIKINDKKELKKNFIIMKRKFGLPLILEKGISGKRELIIGIKKDDNFGHLIMVGAGGIYSEILKDISFRAIPVKKENAQTMIKELKMYSILKGSRGEASVNFDKIENTLLSLSELIQNFSQITAIDINPLIVTSKSAVAVDAVIQMK